MSNTNNKETAPNFLTHNTVGFEPTACIFQLTPEQLGAAIKDIASKEIDGVKKVNYYCDPESGQVRWFIWFDARSDHFLDRKTESTAINVPIARYSEEFKTFAKKYGWNEADEDPRRGSNKVNLNKIMIKNKNMDFQDNWISLQIAINPFLLAMFDPMGIAYNKMYNLRVNKGNLHRDWVYKKGSAGKYHKLVGIQIKKYIPNPLENREEPSAVRSGKFH